MPVQNFDIYNLALILEQQFPEVLFAYIFGSAKEGSVRAGGDVDIAVWVKNPVNKMDLIPRLTGIVESITQGVSCDLILFNEAGSQLAFEALQGRLLFVREEAMDIYSGFYSLTCREYEDTIAWMKKQLQYRGYEVQWDH
ncbi:MAG: nucleotidyltransferase domain-containing protein [Bacteroidales bacterium]|nr:nucleotidyltransferase domain-containing protein [Bacteroidales bacterium]